MSVRMLKVKVHTICTNRLSCTPAAIRQHKWMTESITTSTTDTGHDIGSIVWTPCKYTVRNEWNHKYTNELNASNSQNIYYSFLICTEEDRRALWICWEWERYIENNSTSHSISHHCQIMLTKNSFFRPTACKSAPRLPPMHSFGVIWFFCESLWFLMISKRLIERTGKENWTHQNQCKQWQRRQRLTNNCRHYTQCTGD